MKCLHCQLADCVEQLRIRSRVADVDALHCSRCHVLWTWCNGEGPQSVELRWPGVLLDDELDPEPTALRVLSGCECEWYDLWDGKTIACTNRAIGVRLDASTPVGANRWAPVCRSHLPFKYGETP